LVPAYDPHILGAAAAMPGSRPGQVQMRIAIPGQVKERACGPAAATIVEKLRQIPGVSMPVISHDHGQRTGNDLIFTGDRTYVESGLPPTPPQIHFARILQNGRQP
jgi:hypothetical protein